MLKEQVLLIIMAMIFFYIFFFEFLGIISLFKKSSIMNLFKFSNLFIEIMNNFIEVAKTKK